MNSKSIFAYVIIAIALLAMIIGVQSVKGAPITFDIKKQVFQDRVLLMKK